MCVCVRSQRGMEDLTRKSVQVQNTDGERKGEEVEGGREREEEREESERR